MRGTDNGRDSSDDSRRPKRRDEAGLNHVLDVVGDASPAGARSFLLVVKGENEGKLHGLDHSETVIGRGRTCQLRFEHSSVSQRHARIVTNGGTHFITDLGSTNGTYVNGDQINGSTELRSGDAIQVADVVLAYLSTADKERTVMLRRLTPQLLGMGSEAAARRGSSPDLAYDLESEPAGASLQTQLDRAMLVLDFCKRRWKLVFPLIIVGALLGNGMAFALPPLSEASFDIRLEKGEARTDSQSQDRQTDIFFTEAAASFTSADLIEATLRARHDPDTSTPHVEAVQSALKFEPTGPNTFHGLYQHKSPEEGVEFLKKHVELFLNREIEKTFKILNSKMNFLKQETERARLELAQQETAIRTFKEEHLLGGDNGSVGTVDLSSLESSLAQLTAKAQGLKIQVDYARRSMADSSPISVERKTAVERYETQIKEQNTKLIAAKSKGLADGHPDIVNLKREISKLEDMKRAEINKPTTDEERRISVGYQELLRRKNDLEADYKATSAEAGAIGAQISRIRAAQSRFPDFEAKLSEVTRGYDSRKDIYKTLYDRTEKGRIQLELEKATAKARYEILVAPHSAGVPMRKALITRTGIGGALGMVIGLALALVSELRRFLSKRPKGNGPQNVPITPPGAQLPAPAGAPALTAPNPDHQPPTS